jgi:hypothetical protein
MAVTDLSPLAPGSHVDTPAWQSVEVRMRARAAERRAAKRRRRMRAAAAALALCGVIGLGGWWATTTLAVRRIDAPPAPAPPSAPLVDLARARESVRGAIERYRSAYERLDAAAAQSVWPAIDADALSREFGSLESQQLSFEECAIDVLGSTASATCRGHARVAPRIGGGAESVPRTWRFTLAQAGDGWTIASADVR